MKKALLSLAITAMLGLAAGTASANEVFTVDENSVPGVGVANSFDADLINGSYRERLSIYAGAPLTFATNAFANFTSFVFNGVPQSNTGDQYLGSAGAAGYSMYALFSATGVVGTNTFTGQTGTATLWIDPERDTTKALGLTGSDPITIGLGGDDYMIASTSSFVSGFGIFAANTGAFDLIFKDFLLTTGDSNGIGGTPTAAAGAQNGDLYFTDPRPFHLRINIDGDFNEPSFTSLAPQTMQGDLSLVFETPEPGSLALMGLALAGLGMAQRRRKSV